MNLDKVKYIVSSLGLVGLISGGLVLLLNGGPQVAGAHPGDLFVSPSGSGDCSQASSCDLQTALGLATDGDTVYMAAGIYTGSGGAVVTVTKTITLYGGWDGTTSTPPGCDPDAYRTTLNGEDSRHVVHISGEMTPTVDGLIITGGKAPDGGGIYIYDASPIIRNNVITGNRTITSGTYYDGRGGGIYVGGQSNAVILHNQVRSNTSGYGGGIYHDGWGATVTISANEVVANVASYRGGGIMTERCPDTIQANVISNNTAGSDGGGILVWDANALVEANHITGNSAKSGGGGISIGQLAAPRVSNNVLANNARDGLRVSISSPVVINNTIVGSGLPQTRDGIRIWTNDARFGVYVNNIVIGYEVGIYGTGPITPVIDYNDVWGNTTADYDLPAGVVTGTHGISLDPLFANPAADDYHLQGDSPCVDAGDPAGVPPAPSTDIDGDPRPIGEGVDIGADEARLGVFLPVVTKSRAARHEE
jgi:parallel beta-helix repeat protein